MIRTQISLTKTEYLLAKQTAKNFGISLAELLRRSLRAMLPKEQSNEWMKYAGMVQSGNKNSSQEIDEIVYGHKE